MDLVQVGKAVFVEKSYTTLGIEPRTYSYPGRLVTNHTSVYWVKKSLFQGTKYLLSEQFSKFKILTLHSSLPLSSLLLSEREHDDT